MRVSPSCRKCEGFANLTVFASLNRKVRHVAFDHRGRSASARGPVLRSTCQVIVMLPSRPMFNPSWNSSGVDVPLRLPSTLETCSVRHHGKRVLRPPFPPFGSIRPVDPHLRWLINGRLKVLADDRPLPDKNKDRLNVDGLGPTGKAIGVSGTKAYYCRSPLVNQQSWYSLSGVQRRSPVR